MKMVLLLFWQLPQHILALLFWAALRLAGRVAAVCLNETPPGNVYITTRTPGWGVSLGRYIFLDENYGEDTRKHERGHSLQSLLFGPLYLLAVGLPSAIGNNLWDRLFHKGWSAAKRQRWYYSRYPEAGADRLGGVRRPWGTEGNHGRHTENNC